MIELRQRSSRNSGYQRLSLDEEELDVDDEEDIPLLTRPTPITQSVESSSCANICLVFSLTGVIFLSSIYYLVRKNSPYLKLNETNSSGSTQIDHEFVAEGILNSIFMYCVCAALSALYMYRSAFQRQRDRRFD